MILIGRYLSPFVRRSAVVLKTLGLEFEQKALSVLDDGEEIRRINPIGRVPSLIIDGNEAIVDSHTIIDYALEVGDPENSLMAASGAERRAVRRASIVAVGAMEKAVTSYYERDRRPAEKTYQDWVDHCDDQTGTALAALDGWIAENGNWVHGAHMTLADIDATVAFDFITMVGPHVLEGDAYPALAGLSKRCNELPAFAETQWKG